MMRRLALGATTASLLLASCGASTPKPTYAVGASRAPLPGTYVYAESIVLEKTELHSERSRQVTLVRTWRDDGIKGGPIRRQLAEGGEREGFIAVYQYEWTNDAVVLVAEGREHDPDTYLCKYDAAPLELKLPLRVGLKWKTQGHCLGTDGADLNIAGQAEVTGTAVDKVGKKKVPTFVIKATRVTTSSGQGRAATELRDVSTLHVEANHSLLISEDFTEVGIDKVKVHVRRKINSVSPQADKSK